MKVKQFTLNHFGTNCFVVWDEGTKECAIVDPAAETNYEEAQVTQFIAEQGLTPKMILLTHAHIDHIAGLREMCNLYKLPVSMHRDGFPLLRQSEAYGAVMGFDVTSMDDLPVSELHDNDVLELGAGRLECRAVPGHCPGSMAFVMHEEKMVITGDALFRGSIGRTDLPGGDYGVLMDKLKTRIMTLPDEYEVLPGHGELSTIGEEHLYNGFLI